MGVPLPGVGQFVEDDVAQAAGVVEGGRPDPDRLVVLGVVDAPVAAVGRIEPDPEVDVPLAPFPPAAVGDALHLLKLGGTGRGGRTSGAGDGSGGWFGRTRAGCL